MEQNGQGVSSPEEKEKHSKDVFERIYENYNFMNQRMVQEMELSSEHSGLTGGYREGMWLKFFRSIIPLKYQLAQGVIIIDSERNVSNEVDIAVYDEQYTPYVFQYNTLKFIPIEAVVMVIECKSTSYDPEALKEWSESIQNLKPKASGIARIVQGYAIGETNTSQSRTRPIRVLVSIKASVREETLMKSAVELENYFDFTIEEQKESSSKNNANNYENKKFEVCAVKKDHTLGWWSHELNRGGGRETKDIPMRLEHLDKSDKLKKSTKCVVSEQDKLDLEREVQECRAKQKAELLQRYPELKFSNDMQLTNTLADLRVDGNPLLTLNLQINQLLMLLNNPMMFPHLAYAKAFGEAHKAFDEAQKKK